MSLDTIAACVGALSNLGLLGVALGPVRAWLKRNHTVRRDEWAAVTSALFDWQLGKIAELQVRVKAMERLHKGTAATHNVDALSSDEPT
jgi:hypothetical protein